MAVTTPRLLLALLMLVALPVKPATKLGTISGTRNLAFGRFVAGSGGAITVDPNGVRSRTGGLILLPAGTVSSAAFSFSESGGGKSPTWTTISLPAPNTVRLTSGASSMTVNNFVSNPASTYVGTNTTTATMALTVGATLSVAPNQPAGNYSGTFSVTVNYN